MAEVYVKYKDKIARVPLREEDYEGAVNKRLEKYKQAGAEVGAIIQAPSGKQAFVPTEKVKRYLDAGAVPVGMQKTTVTGGEAGKNWERAEAAAMGVADYGLLGFGDEVAALASPDLPGTFTERLASQRELQAKAREEHPLLYHGAGLGVSLGTGLIGGAKAAGTAAAARAAAPTFSRAGMQELGKQVARTATEGAITGGIAGAGESTALSEGRGVAGLAADVGRGALAGGTISGALPIAGKVVKGAKTLLPGQTQITGKDKLTVAEKGADLINRGAAKLNSILLGKDNDEYLSLLRDPAGRIRARLSDTPKQAEDITRKLIAAENSLKKDVSDLYEQASERYKSSGESFSAAPSVTQQQRLLDQYVAMTPNPSANLKRALSDSKMAIGYEKNDFYKRKIVERINALREQGYTLMPRTSESIAETVDRLRIPVTERTVEMYRKKPDLLDDLIDYQLMTESEPVLKKLKASTDDLIKQTSSDIFAAPKELLDRRKYVDELTEMHNSIVTRGQTGVRAAEMDEIGMESVLGSRRAIGNVAYDAKKSNTLTDSDARALDEMYNNINEAIRELPGGKELAKIDEMYSASKNARKYLFDQFKAKDPITGKPQISGAKVQSLLDKPAQSASKADQQKRLDKFLGSIDVVGKQAPNTAANMRNVAADVSDVYKDIGTRKAMAALEQGSGGPSGRAALLGSLGGGAGVGVLTGVIPGPVAATAATLASPILFPAAYLRATDTVSKVLKQVIKPGSRLDPKRMDKRVLPYLAAKMWLDSNRGANEEQIKAEMNRLGIEY